MTTTKHKPTIDPNFTTDTFKAPKWKNLHFMKDGSTHLGNSTFNYSQEGVELVKNWKPHAPGIHMLNCRVLTRNWSHCIQIPWNKE